MQSLTSAWVCLEQHYTWAQLTPDFFTFLQHWHYEKEGVSIILSYPAQLESIDVYVLTLLLHPCPAPF